MKKGTYSITRNQDIILVRLEGFISGDIIMRVQKKLLELISFDKRRANKVLIGIDITRVSGQNSAARLAGKNMFKNKDVDKIAIWSKDKTLNSITNYIIRSFLPENKAKLFTNEKDAFEWLRITGYEKAQLKKSRRKDNVLIYIGFLMSLLILIFTVWIYWQTKINLEATSKQRLIDISDAAEDKIIFRTTEYASILRSYRGLYAASQDVTAGEFHEFFINRERNLTYEGLTAFTYVARIPANQEQRFLDQLNTDSLLKERDVIVSAILPNKGQAVLYAIKYIEPLPDSNVAYGLEVSDPTRLQNFYDSEEKQGLVLSDTVNLSQFVGREPRMGFYMTVPVYELDGVRSEVPRGYLNAVFEYKNLFFGVLNDQEFNNVSVSISSDGQTIYEHTKASDQALVVQNDIEVEDETWNISASAPTNYGLSRFEKNTPNLILLIGITTAISVFVPLIIATNTKQRAQKLAAYITQDLERESLLLSDKSTQLEALIKSIGEGLIVTDTKGYIFETNPSAEKLLGKSAAELIGKHYPTVIQLYDRDHDKVKPEERPEIQTLLTGMPVVSRNYSFKRGKNFMSVSLTASPYMRDNHPSGIIIVFRDITKEKQLENAKDDFLAIASHQLRTPATAIKQFIGLVLQGYTGKLTAEQSSILGDAYSSNERQITIVQDMLTVARLESGRMSLSLSTFDLSDLIQQSINENKLSFKDRRQSITTKLKKTEFEGDAELLRMAMDNFIGNASKYSPEDTGKIQVTLASKNKQILLKVQDNGVGISNEDRALLFKRFSRIENELSAKVGGSGLGLYIAEKIVRLHDGKVTVKSSTGKGTTFTIHLKAR